MQRSGGDTASSGRMPEGHYQFKEEKDRADMCPAGLGFSLFGDLRVIVRRPSLMPGSLAQAVADAWFTPLLVYWERFVILNYFVFGLKLHV